MKRILALLLLAVFAFGLCGCEKISSIELPPLPTVTPEVAEAAEPSATPAAEPAAQTETESAHGLIVSIKRSTKQAYDPQDGSKLILTFSYDTPTVYIEGGEAAAAAINEQTSMKEDTIYSGNGYGTGNNEMLTKAHSN